MYNKFLNYTLQKKELFFYEEEMFSTLALFPGQRLKSSVLKY